ncbi:hypothetical protein F2Q69_00033616 [Brassica cretica]|uniref:Uncharacterized protein n=1 Tax=Brassica cretica TaxID=69181 RepID=A0A8S9SHR6_BRACR|nr:hypothetical protein F2Q69_00033616 [Brassica cretica]
MKETGEVNRDIRLIASSVVNGDSRQNGYFSLSAKAIVRRYPATVPPSASQRRLLRRRILSQGSATSPPSSMKKKKPKIPPPKPPSISPSKSPPSKTLPKSPLISAAQADPIDSDLTSSREAPKIVSDAQFSSRADAVAQQAVGAPDLALAPSIPPLSKTVIDDRSSDPSSTNINNQSMNLESISVASPPRT